MKPPETIRTHPKPPETTRNHPNLCTQTQKTIRQPKLAQLQP